MRFKYDNLLRSVILLVIGVSPIISIFAQNATGSITGTVTDPNNAVIPNATVTVTNTATGAARKVTTRNEGNYSVENLFPGEYEVKVEAQGFTTQIMELTVQVGNTTTGNFSMSLGVTSQTVEVTGGAPILNTSDSSLGGVVTQKQIDNLPLNGRSFLSVAGLEPGVTISYQATSGVLNQNDFFQVSVAGAPSYMTTISVDGSRANDRITGGTSQNFSSETVQEFQIGTIGFDLSSGTVSAGSVNIVSRSGGNSYHGSGFFYFRDHNMAAFPGLSRACQGLASDDPLCGVPDARKRLDDPFFVRRQYGGTVGGPVKKNKLFFFANYERSDQIGAQPITFTSPLLSGFNHIGQVPFDQHLIGTRVDYRISDKHTAFVRGNIDKNDSVAGNGLESTWIASSNYSYQTQFGLTSVFKPTLVSDFRFSYSYYRNRLFPPSQEMCQSLASDPLFCFGVGDTLINFGSAASGFLLSVGNNANTPQDRHPRTYQYTENISWSKGAHRVRFGGNYEHIYSHGSWFRNYRGTLSTFAPSQLATMAPGLYAALPASLKAGYTGPPPTFAELLQLPISGQVTIGIGDGGQPVEYLYDELTTNNHLRFYIQDAWQIRPRFTLNYGLAWSFEDNQPYHFLDRPEYLRPTGLRLERIPQDYNNFDPALGFAWSLSDKTVIRSSVSLHHLSGNRNYLKLQDQILIGPAGSGLTSGGSGSLTNPRFGQTVPPGVSAQPRLMIFTAPTAFNAQQMLDYLSTLKSRLEAGMPNGEDLSIRNIELRKQAPSIGSEAMFDANYRTPYTIHVNAGLQRQITPNLSVSADFVMRRGVKFGANEGMYEDINRWNRYSSYTIPLVSNPPVAGVIPGVVTDNFRVRDPMIPACTTAQSIDPKAQCSTNSIYYGQPGILSRYTALQIKVDRRFSQGFQFTGAYALSRYTTFNGFSSFTDSSQNFGLSGATPKHAFSFSGIWDLPDYKGRHRLVRGALNDWQLSTIIQMRSRDISTITVSSNNPTNSPFLGFDLEGDGTFTFLLPGTSINAFGRGLDANDIRRLVEAYNDKYPAPAGTPITQIGRANRDAAGNPFPRITLPANFSSGDSFITHDLRMTRIISLTENVKLNLIAEGFNIFNIANLTGYSGVLTNQFFGQPTNRVSPIFGTGGARALQFAARLTF
jgi:Carboxypeptidase regulatory-like domain